jgi:hypothetical protein
MGNEAKCAVEYDGDTAEAKVLLETDALIVRAPFKLTIPFREMKNVEGDARQLQFSWSSKRIVVALGSDASKWAEKIRNPKSLPDKLGIKPGQRISISGKLDAPFIEDLTSRGADVSTRLRAGSDIIFVRIDSREDLDRMVGLIDSLAADGAIWVVRPKGTTAISDSDVMGAGKRAGLVDVKVARFSASHTAEKFVIPTKDRAKHRNRG